QLARRESNAGRGWFRQSIDSERAPVVPAPVPSDEVPATAEVDEAVGLDEAAAVTAVPASIGKPEALRVPASGGDDGQVLRLNRRTGHRGSDRGRAKGRDAA